MSVFAAAITKVTPHRRSRIQPVKLGKSSVSTCRQTCPAAAGSA